jgi:nucleoside-diphosphate-sugar epimerase
MTLLVTGATGFVGRPLVAALRQTGHDVRCLQRSEASGAPAGAAWVHDLREPLPDSLSLRGIDTVLHLAGVAHQWAPPALHEAVNHRATLDLARLALGDGVSNFIFVSSVKAADPEAEGAYARSKRAAEEGLLALARASAMRVICLRPALVYGPGAAGNLAALSAWVQRGLPLMPKAGCRSMVSRDDLVRLLATLVQPATLAQLPSRAVWAVSDGEAYSTRRIALALSAAHGRRPSPLTLPTPVWRALGRLLDLRYARPPGSSADALLGNDLHDNSALCAATGWSPSQRLEDVALEIVASATRRGRG